MTGRHCHTSLLLNSCMAACRGSATLDGEGCVKPAALPSTSAPALAETVPAEAPLAGQLSEVPFKSSGPPAPPTPEAPTDPLASPTPERHGSTIVPANAAKAMVGMGCSPAPEPFCNPPQDESSLLQDLLSNALNKNLGSFHSVDPLVAAVAPTQSEAVSAAPAATTCQSTQLPPQSAAHNPSLANPSEVIDVASEACSTASLIPTSGLTPLPHPSSALGSNSTSTPAFDTSWVPAVSPTTHVPDATKQAINSGKAAPPAPFTPEPSLIQTPTEVSAWPTLQDTLVPALLHNPDPAATRPDESVSLGESVVASHSSGQSTPAVSAVAAASEVTQLIASRPRPGRAAKFSLAEFHNKPGAPITQQRGSDTIPVGQYTILKPCVPEAEPFLHNEEAFLHEQAGPASTGLQPDRSASSFACVAATAKHTASSVRQTLCHVVTITPRSQVVVSDIAYVCFSACC